MERSFAICTKETRKIRMLRISTPAGIPVPAFEDFELQSCKLQTAQHPQIGGPPGCVWRRNTENV